MERTLNPFQRQGETMRKILVLAGLLSLLSLMEAKAAIPFLTPAATPRTACSVSVTCICGGSDVTIECSGTVSCHAGPRSVTCDGLTDHCPPIGSCPH
jgi:hypothetical protein